MIVAKLSGFLLLLLWYSGILLAILAAMRRNKWQFSLRSLLVSITVVAVLCGFFTALVRSME